MAEDIQKQRENLKKNKKRRKILKNKSIAWKSRETTKNKHFEWNKTKLRE